MPQPQQHPARPTQRQPIRYPATLALPLAILCGGIAVSLTVYFAITSAEREAMHAKFESASRNRVEAIQREVNTGLQALKSVAAFYAASNEVEREEFRRFVMPLLGELPQVHAIEWVPCVPDAERNAYEQAARAQGFKGYEFVERDAMDRLVHAKPREMHYPIWYIEPFDERETAFGFDFASEPDRLQALRTAGETGQMVTAGRLSLADGRDDRVNLVVIRPVYRNDAPLWTVDDRRAALTGFIAIALRPDEIIEGSLSRFAPEGMDIRVRDVTNPEDARILCIHPSRTRPDSHASGFDTAVANRRFAYTTQIDVAGQTWEISCAAAPAFIRDNSVWYPTAGLVIGILISMLASVHAHSLVSRHANIHRLVGERTHELGRSHRALKRANQALRGISQLQTAILNSANCTIISTDASGVIQTFNAASERTLGYRANDLVGRQTPLLLHRTDELAARSEALTREFGAAPPDGFAVLTAKARQLVADENEWTYVRKDGSEFPIRLSATALLDETSRITGFLFVGFDISEQRAAETALRKSEYRFRQAILDSPFPLMLHADDGEVLLISKTWTDVSGYMPAEIPTIGAWVERAYGTPHESVQSKIDALYSYESMVRHGEMTITTKSGEQRIWDLCTAPLGGAADGRRLLISAASDITERVTAETQLRCAMAREADMNREISFQKAALDLATIVTEADGEGRIIYANDAFCRISGYSREELIGQDHRILDSGKHSQAFWREMYNALASNSVWQGTICNRSKSGELYWHYTTIVAFRDEHYRITRYVCIRTDLTDRVQAEASLRESEERFRQLAETIREVFWLTSADGSEFHYVSPAFENIWGLPCKTVYEDQGVWSAGIIPEDRPRVRAALAACANGQRYDEIYRVARRDGATRWVRDRGFPIRDQNGQVYRIAGIAEDISDRKRIESALLKASEEAEAASRAKSDFLATMSHELRTPLNGVIGMAELLRGTPLNPQQEHYASLVKSSADMLLSLINDILDFSKIESGKLELEEIDFDLRDAIESVMTSFAPRAEQKGLELINGIHPNVPTALCGDPGRLQQVLMNLVSNAIKFTDRGEVIARVTLDEETDEHALIRFTVSDTGIGIRKDRIGMLFTSFTQADASTTRRFGGTGLGLAIAKQLAYLQGGDIGVMSDDGKGSTFWFTARLRKNNDVQQALRVPSKLRRVRVLVVDDNATNREVLHEQLTSWRLEHGFAENGEEALNALRAATADAPFDIALLDMHMPGMNGAELAAEIKADPAIAGTALVLLSSLQINDPEQLEAMGFVCCMSKPVRQSRLLDAIMHAVSGDADDEDAASISPDTAAAAHAPDGRKIRILLAEDHEVSQEVASTVLRRAGYDCDIAENGAKAFEKATTNHYDVVLMDCQMPEMDGFAATNAIRQVEAESGLPGDRTSRLPIIALTANAIKGDRERCLEAGMDDYLTKPLEPQKLLNMIQRHCAAQMTDAVSESNTPAPPPDASAPPPEDCPFDVESTAKRWGNDTRFVHKLIRKFCTQTPPDLEKLAEGLAAGDAETCQQLSHRMKGAASYVGAEVFRRNALELENQAHGGDLSGAQELLVKLQQEMERCLEWASAEFDLNTADAAPTGGFDANPDR